MYPKQIFYQKLKCISYLEIVATLQCSDPETNDTITRISGVISYITRQNLLALILSAVVLFWELFMWKVLLNCEVLSCLCGRY